MSTIPFNRELAEDFRRNLSPMMYEWDDASGRYICRFCWASCTPCTPGAVKLNEIEHFDCLGEKLLKELDAKLSNH